MSLIVGIWNLANDLWGGVNNDTLYGGQLDDTMHGGAGNDTFHGGAGNDLQYGGAGNDIFFAGYGSDSVYGGAGNDIISAGNGRSVLGDHMVFFGGDGNDRLTGGVDADSLYGGADNDTIWGGAGNDLIQGGTGVDWLSGGLGADTFVFATVAEAQGDYLTGLEGAGVAGGDIVNLQGIDANWLVAGNQTFVFGSHAIGGVWVEDAVGGNTAIHGNNDGIGGTFDWTIIVQDGATLASAYTAGDFIL